MIKTIQVPKGAYLNTYNKIRKSGKWTILSVEQENNDPNKPWQIRCARKQYFDNLSNEAKTAVARSGSLGEAMRRGCNVQ
jgi:hypothetical protein